MIKYKSLLGIGSISLGTFIGQGTLLFTTIFYLKEYYSPENYGELSIFVSAISFLSIISTMKYEYTIPLEKNVHNKNTIGKGLITISLLISSLIGLGLLIADRPLKEIIYYPIGCLLFAMFTTFRMWQIDKENYINVALSNVLKPLLQIAIPLGAYFLAFNTQYSLIEGVIGGLIISVVLLIPFNLLLGIFKINKKRLYVLAKNHINFPKFTLPATVLTQAGTTLLPLWIAFLYSKSITGQYAMINTIYAIPIALLGSTFSQVLYPKMAKLVSDPIKSKSLIYIAIKVLSTFSFIFFIPLIFFSKELIGQILGPKWNLALQFGNIMVIHFFFMLISSPISSFALIKGKQKTAMQISTIELITRWVSIGAGALLFNSPMKSILFFSITSAIIYITYLNWILRLNNSNIFRFLADESKFFKFDKFIVPFYLSIYIYNSFNELSLLSKIIIISIPFCLTLYNKYINLKNDESFSSTFLVQK